MLDASNDLKDYTLYYKIYFCWTKATIEFFKKLEDKNICLASNTRRHSCKKNKKNKLWCKGFVAYVFVTAKNLGKGIKNLLCYQPSPYVLKIFGVNKAIVIDVLCICSLPRLFLKISRYNIRKKCLKKATSNM